MDSYEDRLCRLCMLMEQYAGGDMLVAYSGGVDSGLLLKLAADCALSRGNKVYAVTVRTSLHPVKEMEDAVRSAEETGAISVMLEVDELNEAGILYNPVDRCYLCKRYLFERILKKAEELSVKTVLEGTNEDDLHVYRPGVRAVRELGVCSPLAEAGFTKEDVRRLARERGLEISGKPSAPCLATRFPYGTQLSEKAIRRVEEAEAYVKAFGIGNLRLRVHGDTVRIEVDEEDMERVLAHRKAITAYLRQKEYSYVTLDLEGFCSGSMDMGIKK